MVTPLNDATPLVSDFHTPVVELVYMLGLEPSAFGIESSNLSGCTERGDCGFESRH